MPINVLLSIKPKYAAAILSGDKQFEFRRTIFKNPNVKKVYIYASKPIGLIVGEFEIEEVLSLETKTLWNTTKKTSGISKQSFDSYFKGKKIGYALKVRKAEKYEEPISLMDKFNISRPPQSFMYV